MTRTPKEAAEGRLNLIVGAPDVLLQEVLPLLQSFAENITHAGPVGAGHQLKLLHNFVSLGFSAVLAEAAAAAKRADVPASVFVEVLAKGRRGRRGAGPDEAVPAVRGCVRLHVHAVQRVQGSELLHDDDAGSGRCQRRSAGRAGGLRRGGGARPIRPGRCPELVAILSEG